MFSKINKNCIYLTDKSKNECNTLTIHMINNEYFNTIKQLLIEYGINITTLIAKPNPNRDFLKNMEWVYMMPYEKDEELIKSIIIQLIYSDTEKSFINQFINKLGNPVIKNKSIWFPTRIISLNSFKNKKLIETEKIIPKYPIYIITKGRYESGTTAKYLDLCNIDYKLVVEPNEYELYVENGYDPKHILITPENFSIMGNGSIPVRNFVWEHSKMNGDERHWILDDNIYNYFNIHKSQKTKIYSGAIFRQVEDYVDRYTNIKMAGHNYSFFVMASQNNYPIIKNTRIYSSILLSNDIYPEFKWRGRYNEDTDLSLRILKAGFPTILFNNICANKATTMSVKGGNTNTIYSVEQAHLKKTQELVNSHPDCCKVINRFGRIHHLVNYKIFKNLLPIWKDKVKENLPIGNNTYNLIYIDI